MTRATFHGALGHGLGAAGGAQRAPDTRTSTDVEAPAPTFRPGESFTVYKWLCLSH